ncbi:MAG: hypothetical protein VKL39_10960 [Leptolyngbyaceae bacterium]|nr:hypothetical protein [Leptolyngbyaceae bacterium]
MAVADSNQSNAPQPPRELTHDIGSTPDNLSFADTIAFTQTLLAHLENDPTDAESNSHTIAQTIAHLLSSKAGARGFLATYLTYDGAIADQPPDSIINGLRAKPDIVADMMVKNLAMSSAMAIAHQRNQDEEHAKGSRRVQQRTRHLIEMLETAELGGAIREMVSSLEGTSSYYQPFLEQQRYDTEQREALKTVFKAIALKTSTGQ